MDIAAATIDMLGDLSALALRSKAYWGYDDSFIEACRAELTLTPDRLEREVVLTAIDDGTVVGFASVLVEGRSADLMDLFVEPDRIGMGVGGSLLASACEAARAGGAGRLVIEADPHAEHWYRSQGAVRIGRAPSGSIPGRFLPLLEIPLDPPARSAPRREPALG